MPDRTDWEAPMLEELARMATYPTTPSLWPGVSARLAAPPAPMQDSSRWRYAFAALAVALATGALTLGLWRDARDAVADFLGLAVEGERVEILPTPAGGGTATPLPTPVTLEQSATRISGAEAAGRLGFEPVLPASLGEPRAFYAVPLATPPVIVADYGEVQVWQFPLDGQIFIGKGVPAGGGTVVAQLTVNGQPAYWVEGGSRLVEVRGADGTPIAGTARTVTEESLIWAEGGVYLRVEGAGSRAAALSLAAEMRPGN